MGIMDTIVVIEKMKEEDLGIKTKGSWFVREYEDQESFDADCEMSGGFHKTLEDALEAVKDIFEEAELWV
jgi:hypothetical protein